MWFYSIIYVLLDKQKTIIKLLFWFLDWISSFFFFSEYITEILSLELYFNWIYIPYTPDSFIQAWYVWLFIFQMFSCWWTKSMSFVACMFFHACPEWVWFVRYVPHTVFLGCSWLVWRWAPDSNILIELQVKERICFFSKNFK